MPEVKTKRKGRGRPKGSKNKPKTRVANDIAENWPGRRIPLIPLVVPVKEHEEILGLADQTKITPEQVLSDVIKTGLVAVRKTLYVGLIQNRLALEKELEKELENEKNSTNGDAQEHEIAPIPYRRRPDLPPMATAASPAAASEPLDAAFGRGLEETLDPDTQEPGGEGIDAEPAPEEEFPLEEEEPAEETANE